MQPAGSQPLEEGVTPPGADQPRMEGPDDLPWIQEEEEGVLIHAEGGGPFAGEWQPGEMNVFDRDAYQAAEDWELPEAPPLEEPRNPQRMEEPLPPGGPSDDTHELLC